MTIGEDVRERYARLVERMVFADEPGEVEQALAESFELGRHLAGNNLGNTGEVVALHHDAIIHLAREHPGMPLDLIAERLTRPMMELSMAYGLAYGLAFREHENRLAECEREFRALVEHSTDHIARFDLKGRLLYANPTMAKTLSCAGAFDLQGKRLAESFPDGIFAKWDKAVLAVAVSGEGMQITQEITAESDHCLTLQIRLVAERNASGTLIGVLCTGHDITDILYYQKKMHALAYFDALTGLPNRTLFNDRIHHAAVEAAHDSNSLGLMLLDLDNFKAINDALGHAVGDRLLHQTARRLEVSVRAGDTVARLGGDEFVIILPNIHDRQVLRDVASHVLDVLTDPYQIDQHELFVSSSIGIAVYPDDSGNIETLLKYADSAMYYAKKKGRNNFQFYSRDLTIKSKERMVIESALRQALNRKEMELYYQPQVDLVSGSIIGAEALLRWNRRDGSTITPDCFIPVAEETGLIVGIGEWVLLDACKTAAAWNRERQSPLVVAVNLSSRQFIKTDLPATLRQILNSTGCRAEWLKLEITESLLLEDSDSVLSVMNELKAMGFSIAIDDFGTGYSALSYLNRFPVSQIKIDRTFVSDVPHDRDKSELVKAIISIAKALRLELVAEGVETPQQADYLHVHGCAMAQGYLFGKPMRRHQYEKLLSDGCTETADVRLWA